MQDYNKITPEQFKLLTDIIWGWDLGKMSWMCTIEEVEQSLKSYRKNIIPIFREREAVTGEKFEYLVGYALLAQVSMTEDELIQKERLCSHAETWDVNGNLYYLSEVVIHKDYRNNGRTFQELMLKTIKHCKENNIQYLYTTAVSDDSRRLISNKRNKESITILAEKEEKRIVCKIDINKLKIRKTK